MNQINYQKELESLLVTLSNQEPKRLLLHSCCAPCSSYCLEYLCEYFKITVFYYNPNISQSVEYQKRVAEQKRLIKSYNLEMDQGKRQGKKIDIIEGDYDPLVFLNWVKGYENCPEGGERCFKCFHGRLFETVKKAKEGQYDFFGTTLTISPLKNAGKINEIGRQIESECGVKWLPSDFKKKNGYKRSVELSAIYDLYRQDFCGCGFSKAEAELRRKKEEK